MCEYYEYILASKCGVLYIGVTNDLGRRVFEHREKLFAGFTERYNVSRLVYVESFSDVRDAIAREKQLKGWRRDKKIAMIERDNPTWTDLSAAWSNGRDASTSSA